MQLRLAIRNFVQQGKMTKRRRKKTRISREEGPLEEVYTDEHEKLLGTCETSWTLFVDGYSKDGVRIYDQVKGKSCHQCRQKTLGHRTHCSKCNLVQGQFCGDCLYMRYGENVLEANENPNWICPVCRGICNCSLCRTKKGWAPTGILYKKILRLGFKSVAHFLIQTKCVQTNVDDLVSSRPIPAKRSLPFTDEVGPLQISNCNNNNNDHCNEQMIVFDGNKDKGNECSGDRDMQTSDEYGSISTSETSKMSRKKRKKETESALIVRPNTESIAGRLRSRSKLLNNDANSNDNDHCNRDIILIGSDYSSQLCCDEGKDVEWAGNEEMQNLYKCAGNPTLGKARKTTKKQKEEMQTTLTVKPSPDSIAGRLRSHGTRYEGSDSNGAKQTRSPDEHDSSITVENSEKVDKSSKEKDLDQVTVPSLSCVTGMQRNHSILNKDSGCKSRKNNIALRSDRKLGNKGKELALLVQQSIDCIGRRLRSRGSSYEGSDWRVAEETHNTMVPNNVIALESNEKPRERASNKKELALIVIPTLDSIAGRLRSRHKNDGCNREMGIMLEANRRSGNKPNNGTTLVLPVKPNMDCIAGRLRRSLSCV